MPIKIGSVSRSTLTGAALPAKTQTYTVISHNFVITTILQTLQNYGFQVESEEYRCTANAQVAHGVFHINYQGDPELSMVYSFSNSYDKSLRFRAAIGARILVNNAYMISEDDHWKRKHTGTSDQETADIIEEHIKNAQSYFDQLATAKEAMKAIEIDRDTFGATVGRLLFNGFLAIDQVSLVFREYNSPSFQYAHGKNNLWTCYCHIMYALKQAHPSKWMQSQVGIHLFFATTWNLLTFDDDTDTANDGGPAVGDTMVVAKTELPDLNVGDEITVDNLTLVVTGESVDNDEDIELWVCKIIAVNPTTVVIEGEEVPVIPGILSGVEVAPVILPGFGEIEDVTPTDELPQTSSPEPHQVTIEEVIAEEEAKNTVIDSEETIEFDPIESEFPAEVHSEDMNITTHVAAHTDGAQLDAVNIALSEAGLPPADAVIDVNIPEKPNQEPEQTPEEIAKEAVDKGTEQMSVIKEEFLNSTETMEESKETEEVITDYIYLPRDQFEGYQIGDVFEEDEQYVEVMDIITEDGVEYLAVKPVGEEEEIEEIIETIDEANILPQPNAAAAPIQEMSTSAPAEDPLENEIEEIQISDIPEIEPTIETVDTEDPIYKAIAEEILEIYGSEMEFTYTSTDTQFNVVLSDNTTITLAITYIKNKLK